jgi:hypothetical protein
LSTLGESILRVLRDILDEERKLPVISIVEVILSGISAGMAIAVVPGFTAKLKQLCGKKKVEVSVPKGKRKDGDEDEKKQDYPLDPPPVVRNGERMFKSVSDLVCSVV